MATVAQPIRMPGSDQAANGPLTASRLLRSRLIHGAMCIAGAGTWLLDASPAWQAFGWGLWLPGMGFVSVGGWALLLVPVTLILFGVAFIAWFGSGMIIAPIAIWLGAALVAGLLAGQAAMQYAPYAVPVITVAFLSWSALHRARRLSAALERRARRLAALPATVQHMRLTAVPAPPVSDNELSPLELSMVRYALDRALQPIGQLQGFDRIDQFQTSALRYQLNQVGWLLAIAQRHHFPNFHGYANEAQRRLIDQYREKAIWGYWTLEQLWGNLSLDTDPAKKDNIMLTGYVSINALLYALNTGDERYGAPGSMSFRDGGRDAYSHDIHSIIQSMLDNFEGRYRQPFCLYPCEPNWIYPACNFRGLTGIRLYDTVYGTDHFDRLRDRFRISLEQEFVRPDGGIVPLRSKLTGHELPFPAPDAVNVKMLSPLYPDLAETYWAIVRAEDVYTEGGETRIRVPEKALDFGNYKSGNLFVYDGYLGAATEMGDRAVVEAGRAAVLASGKLIQAGGVTSFQASNMANVSLMESWLNVTGGWRDAILRRPSDAVLKGPVLDDANYPETLVALAVSSGDDLRLVLHPGGEDGMRRIGLARLRPGAAYRVAETGHILTADDDGRATIGVALYGRTSLHIIPEGWQ